MSAIAGIVSLSGKPIDASLIERLTLSMTARGPDRRQTWQTERVALGHCLLRTTPEALHEEQPMASNDCQLRIVFDGRLDNRSELFRELRARNVAIRDETDPALVLAAYSLWGEKVPERLLGDFAFAIWDGRENKVFCARDHIGNRPCYYVQTADFLAFASEDATLLDVPGVSAAPNDPMVASAYVFGLWRAMTEYSWLQDVRVLMPGRSVTAHLPSGRVAWTTYWAPSTGSMANYSSVEEAMEAFRAVFFEAVRGRLRSNGPPAALLSGGMDSASIAATLCEFQNEGDIGPIHAYSAVHDRPESCVESQKILTLAAVCSDVHHRQSVPSYAGEVDFDAFFSFMYDKSHPVELSVSLVALMCLMAQQNGHRVLMHGASADCCSELGENYAEHYVGRLSLPELWRECQQASAHHSYVRGRPAATLMAAAIIRRLLPTQQRLLWQRGKRHLQPDPITTTPINELLATDIGARQRLAALLAANPGAAPFSFASQRRTAIFPLGIVHGLEAYERVAGRAGVEMRDPYADRRVVEFFLALPPELLVRQGWTKYLVRRTFANQLPDNVVWSSDKTHVGRWVFDRMLQPALLRMRAAGAPALDAFGRYFNPLQTELVRSLLSGALPPDKLTELSRRTFAADWIPLALWAAQLQARHKTETVRYGS